MKRYLVIIICILVALSCSRQNSTSFSEDQFRRSLEQAIELSEKIQEERALIEQVALTQGTDAAAHLHDSIHYRQHINDLWDIILQAETLCDKLPPECGTIERVW